MGFLYVGSDANVLQAEDRVVVTLEFALSVVARRYTAAVLVSELAYWDGVSTRAAVYDPGVSGLDRCWFESDLPDVSIDAEYLQRALDCADALDGWIVLEANDEVVTDSRRAAEIKRRSVSMD
ncbi:hypothetical protein [Rhodococcus rhodochrous]|uniref:hypothetical protein n=1 Tax=Rhodococcus rhodochrous TaxID=1829 RepID=UPI001CE286BB|nr:hypothetical protein [Rhodococcus rhodochrous]